MHEQDLRDDLEVVCSVCQRDNTQQLERALSWSHYVTLKEDCGKHSSPTLPIPLILHGFLQNL